MGALAANVSALLEFHKTLSHRIERVQGLLEGTAELPKGTADHIAFGVTRRGYEVRTASLHGRCGGHRGSPVAYVELWPL